MFAVSIFEHVFGIPYFPFGEFYFMYGFLIFTDGEWSLTYARQEICHRATPPALMLVL